MLRRFALCLATFIALLQPLGAEDRREPVDLALVLAVDASGSVKPENWLLQLEGYAAAFRSKPVQDAIRSGLLGSIAVTLVQWEEYLHQHQSVRWHRIHDAASANAFAHAILSVGRRYGYGTSIAGALLFSDELIRDAPFDYQRCVIDISGDGVDDYATGLHLDDARSRALARGCTINGLPIIDKYPLIVAYYRHSVIGGPGAFAIPADGYEMFAESIRKKLILEIAQR